MRMTICLAMATLLSGPGCDIAIQGSGPATRGSGVTKQEKREVPAFTGIEIGSSFGATVTIGPKSSVTLDVEDNLLPLVKTDVRDGRLVVGYASGHSIHATKPQKVTIVVPSLDFLEGRGSSRIVATTNEGKALTIVAEGASSLVLNNLASESVDIKVTGASQVTLSGRGKHMKLSLSGASKILAEKAPIESATVELDGASRGELNVSTSIEGTASGASSLKVFGGPKTRAVKTSGASSVSY